MKVSVVVPVYNSADSLIDLMNRLSKSIMKWSDEFEVILVNDGSSDGSWEIMCDLAKSYPFIHAINLMRNYGQHNALLCGIRAARYDVIVTMDDDLQHPPEEILKLVTALQSNFDVIYGVYEEKRQLWRSWTSRLTKLMIHVAFRIHGLRSVSAFRAFGKPARDVIIAYQGSCVNIDVLLSWSTKRIGTVRVRHDLRKKGNSNYNFYKLFNHTWNVITGYSAAPLRFSSLVGFGFTLFGVGVFAYVVLRYFIHGVAVQGFAFLSSIIAIFAGAQLFALGIIGEYLARIHFRIMDRPPYAIREEQGALCENSLVR